MQKYLIASLLLVIVVVIFALQNAATVTITLWFWNIEAPLALAILTSLLIGALAGVLFSGKRKKVVQIQDNTIKENP